VAGTPVLLTVESPVLHQARHLAALSGLAALGTVAIVLAVRMGRAVRAALAQARTVLLDRRVGPGVLLSSVAVLAGYLLMFLVAARAVGSDVSPAALLPLAVLALIAMGLPLNVGGWGPREGVTAWAFGAAGLGAATGLSIAVVYGVLGFAASLPGAVVLVVRWYTGLRTRRAGHRPTTQPAGPVAPAGLVGPTGPVGLVASAAPVAPVGPMASAGPVGAVVVSRRTPPVRAGAGGVPYPVRNAPCPRSPPTRPRPGPARRQKWSWAIPSVSSSGEVTREKYAPKESASAASSRSPFSAEASEGRPMTPDSV
jgi:hypothetical protein